MTSSVQPLPADRRMPRGMEALAYPEFRRFWTASAVSNAGSLVHMTAIGWAVEILTDDPLKVTLTATAGLAPLVLLSPYAGTLADRFPRRNVLLGSVSAQTIVAFSWALLFSLTDVNYTTLFLFSLFGGIANSLGQPVQQVMAVDLVPPEGMRNAITLNSVQWNVARAVGPLIAGVLIDQFSVAAAFWVNAVSYGAMIIMLLRIQHRPATGASRDWRAEFKAGLSYVRNYRPLAVALSFGSMVAVMLGPPQNLVPVIARDGFEVGAGRFGILAAAFGVGSVVGGILVLPTEHRFRHSQLVGGGLAFMSVAMFALAVAPQFWFGVAAMFLIGAGFVASTSNLVSAMQALSSDEYRGRVMSLWLMAFGLASPFAVVAQGAAAKYFGIRWAVGGTAIVGMLAFLYGNATGLIREIDPAPPASSRSSRFSRPRRPSIRTGYRAGMAQMDIRENTERRQFELHRDGVLVGFATYSVEGDTLVVPHVETFPEHRGQGFAAMLMDGLLEILRVDGRRIVPLCSFAADHIKANSRHHDLVRSG